QIKGKINWQRTIKEPERIRSKNKMIISVNEQNREYAIKENLIVLEALETIHHILMYHIDFNHLQRYEWFNDWNYLKISWKMCLIKTYICPGFEKIEKTSQTE